MSAFDDLFSNDAFKPFFSRPVTYRRGALEAEVQAMDSKIETSAQLELGASIVVEAREWLVEIPKLNDVFTRPERGDQILAGGEIWELTRIGNAPDWELDNDRLWYRLRTVQVGV